MGATTATACAPNLSIPFVENVVTVAGRQFAERGYDGVSIRDLAQSLGSSNAVLYYHFGSKEDLFLFVCEQKFEDMYGAVTERLEALPRERRMASELAAIIFDVLIVDPDMYYLINRAMVNSEPQRACMRVRQLYLRLRTLIEYTLGFSHRGAEGEALSYSFDAVVNGFASFALANYLDSGREQHVRQCRDNLRFFVERSF